MSADPFQWRAPPMIRARVRAADWARVRLRPAAEPHKYCNSCGRAPCVNPGCSAEPVAPLPPLRMTHHAIESYTVFYPRTLASAIPDEVRRGIPIPSGEVQGLCGRRSGDGSGSGYVLHRERTGIFVVAGAVATLTADPVVLDVPLVVVTFLRFYSLDQRRTAVAMYGAGDPVSSTCAARWRVAEAEAAVDTAEAQSAAHSPKPGRTRVVVNGISELKIPRGRDGVRVNRIRMSDAIARAHGGRPNVRRLLAERLADREPLPSGWSEHAVPHGVPADHRILASADLGSGPLLLLASAGHGLLVYAAGAAPPPLEGLAWCGGLPLTALRVSPRLIGPGVTVRGVRRSVVEAAEARVEHPRGWALRIRMGDGLASVLVVRDASGPGWSVVDPGSDGPTPEETRAATVLRESGWAVGRPPWYPPAEE